MEHLKGSQMKRELRNRLAEARKKQEVNEESDDD
jgi:hypothetical protein